MSTFYNKEKSNSEEHLRNIRLLAVFLLVFVSTVTILSVFISLLNSKEKEEIHSPITSPARINEKKIEAEIRLQDQKNKEHKLKLKNIISQINKAEEKNKSEVRLELGEYNLELEKIKSLMDEVKQENESQVDENEEDNRSTISHVEDDKEVLKMIQEDLQREIFKDISEDNTRNKEQKQEEKNEAINLEKELRIEAMKKISKRQFTYMVVQISAWKEKFYNKESINLIISVLRYLKQKYPFFDKKNEEYSEIPEKNKVWLDIIGRTAVYMSYVANKVDDINENQRRGLLKKIEKEKLKGFNILEFDVNEEEKGFLCVYIDDNITDRISKRKATEDRNNRDIDITLLEEIQWNLLNPKNLEEMEKNKSKKIRLILKKLKELKIIEFLLNTDKLFAIDGYKENESESRIVIMESSNPKVFRSGEIKTSVKSVKSTNQLKLSMGDESINFPNNNDFFAFDSFNFVNDNDNKSSEKLEKEKDDIVPLRSTYPPHKTSSRILTPPEIKTLLNKQSIKDSESRKLLLKASGTDSITPVTKGVIFNTQSIENLESRKLLLKASGADQMENLTKQDFADFLIKTTNLQLAKIGKTEEVFDAVFEEFNKMFPKFEISTFNKSHKLDTNWSEEVNELILFFQNTQDKLDKINEERADEIIKEIKDKADEADKAENKSQIELGLKNIKLQEQENELSLDIYLSEQSYEQIKKQKEQKEKGNNDFFKSKSIITAMRNNLLAFENLKKMKEKKEIPTDVHELKIVKFLLEEN